MKQALVNAMAASGAFATFRTVNRGKLLVVMYHRFGDVPYGGAVSAREFEMHVSYLARHYTLMPLGEAGARIASGRALPPRPAAITIDDGYRDTYEIAFPILRAHCAPATVFVVTGFVDRRAWLWTDKMRFITWQTLAPELRATIAGRSVKVDLRGSASRARAAAEVNAALKTLPNEGKERAIEQVAALMRVDVPLVPPNEYLPLAWSEVQALDRVGVEVGSHTVTHPILTQLRSAHLRAEVRESKARLEEELERPVSLFCYPNGDANLEVRREVRDAGYSCAVSTEFGLNGRGGDALALRRVPAQKDFAYFLQSTSGFEGAKLALRRGMGKWPSALGSRRGMRHVP